MTRWNAGSERLDARACRPSPGASRARRRPCPRARAAQRSREHHLGALAARVGDAPVELPRARLQVVDVQAPRVHAAGGHEEHARRRARDQALAQQAREQVRPEHVRRERQLEPLLGLAALARQHAGVVHEHVHRARRAASRRSAQAAHRAAQRDVDELAADVVVARLARRSGDGPPRPRAASRTSSRSDAPSRASPSARREPEPPLAPVTRQTRPSRRRRIAPVLDAPAHDGTDAREAADHARLERRVDQPGEPAAGRHAGTIPAGNRAKTLSNVLSRCSSRADLLPLCHRDGRPLVWAITRFVNGGHLCCRDWLKLLSG